MEKDSGTKLDALRVDGGMVADDLLMQFQADILDRPVVRPVTTDATTALGAAYAAGLAVGYFKGLNDLRTNWAADRTWTPNLKNGKRDEMYNLWKRAVTRSFDWVS
jgi:glycerol kinase